MRTRPAPRASGRCAALPALLLLLSAVFTGCTSRPNADATATAGIPASPTVAPATLTPSPSATATITLQPSATQTPTATPGPQRGEVSIGDAYAPELGNTGYDVLHYQINLDVSPGLAYLRGATTITAVPTLHNLVEFSLDFTGFEILELSLDGAPVDYTRDGAKLHILLETGLPEGTPFDLLIRYEGAPVQQGSPFVPFFDHLGFQFLGPTAFTYNQPDGAHTWFPCNDHPRDKASFSFDLAVPNEFTAVSNGTLTGVEEDGNRTHYYWDSPNPMATYLALVAIGDYVTIETESPGGIPIQHYIFEDLRIPFNDAADVTGEALDWMAGMFGKYPFERFGFVTTRLIRASLETQGNVLLNEDMLNEETVIHEIAHMWFGDWVTMASWADMWHNEGFAIYVSLMWQTRDNPASLNIFMQNLEARVEREASPDPLGGLSPNRLFGFDSYQRGALMLHYLRQEVGDEAFFESIRVYLDRYGGGVATRDDFIGVFEEVSGADLGDFFFRWLETQDYP